MTDRRTDILRRHSPRYAYASRGKNRVFLWVDDIYIVLYADDMFIAPTVCELQKLLHVCQHELNDLDFSIVLNK